MNDAVPAPLAKLWASLPALECRGLCHESCGPILMSAQEHQLVANARVPIPDGFALMASGRIDCPALTLVKRCAVHDVRPTICRLWGAVESMPCPHGCVPEGGYLSAEEGRRILTESVRISKREK